MSISFASQNGSRHFGRSSTFNRRRSFQKSGLSIALPLKLEIGPKVVVVFLFLVSVLMSLMYLAHFNKVATKGYEVKRLDANRQQLLAQYGLSDMHLAETKTMDRLVNSDKVVHMKSARRVTFVNSNTALASAERL